MKTVYAELSIECTLKAKDLYRIMPPDNKMRRRIVDASTVLGKAAKALVEAENLLAVCRDNPRAEDEERLAELEAKLDESFRSGELSGHADALAGKPSREEAYADAFRMDAIVRSMLELAGEIDRSGACPGLEARFRALTETTR